MKSALLLLLSELAVIFVLVSVVHALAGLSPVVQVLQERQPRAQPVVAFTTAPQVHPRTKGVRLGEDRLTNFDEEAPAVAVAAGALNTHSHLAVLRGYAHGLRESA